MSPFLQVLIPAIFAFLLGLVVAWFVRPRAGKA